MGCLTSQPSQKTVVVDGQNCPTTEKIPYSTGKFLLQSFANRDEGVYMSVNSEGNVCGSLNENDSELFRVLYNDEITSSTNSLLFSLYNTGRRCIVCTKTDGSLESIPWDEQNKCTDPSQLYFAVSIPIFSP